MLDAIPFIYQEQRRLAGRTGFANILSAVVANKGLASEVGVGSTDASTQLAGIYFGSAHDTNLYRSSAGTLKTDSMFYGGAGGGGGYSAQMAGALLLGGSTAGTTPSFGLLFANSADTNLYRSAANELKTDGYFHTGAAIFAYDGGANQVRVGGTNSAISFGLALDTNLYRSAAGELSLAASSTRDGSLILGYLSSLRGIDVHSAGGSSQSTFMSYLNATDSVPTFLIRGGGKHEWGPGGAAAMDAYIERMAVAQLKFTGNVQATDGFATKTKAGTPSDADFTTAPPTGTIVVDTTANKIWVRTGAATWKGVVVA